MKFKVLRMSLTLTPRYTIQRVATGAEGLEAEESDNTSFGGFDSMDGLI